MSATGRSNCRVTNDAYPTPAWCVRRLLDAVPLPGGRWLEPTAGAGSIITAVDDWRATRGLEPVTWDACEINQDYRKALAPKSERVVIGDLLGDAQLRSDYDVAITNPPFEIAADVFRECRKRARIVVLLLRANFKGSAERDELFRTDHPNEYALPNRPTFVIVERWDPKKGKWIRTTTDSCEVSWFCWGEQRRDFGISRRLALTPAGVRAFWRKRAPVVRIEAEGKKAKRRSGGAAGASGGRVCR